MGTIVAIGGGEISEPYSRKSTLSIDRHIIELSGKKHPNLLFIPTASKDSPGYIKTADNYFGKLLGCHVDTLCLTANPSQKTIDGKIEIADIIYVGGGNTKSMIELWKEYDVIEKLRKAYESGKILSGLSAGAICWFSYGHSDSLKEKTNNYCLVKGLGFIKGIACPHVVKEKDRLPSFKRMVKEQGGLGYAIDDCAAIVFAEEKTYVVQSKKSANASIYTRNSKKKIKVNN